MVFHKKSYTFDVLFNIKDEMLDLKQLTVEVCRIATEAGHFLKEAMEPEFKTTSSRSRKTPKRW